MGIPGEYVITFPGSLGEQGLSEIEAFGEEFLAGAEARADVEEMTKGTTSGTIVAVLLNGDATEGSGTVAVTDLLPAGLRAKETGEPVRAGQAATASNRSRHGGRRAAGRPRNNVGERPMATDALSSLARRSARIQRSPFGAWRGWLRRGR